MRPVMGLAKPLSGVLVVAILSAVIPYRAARAELVTTESVVTGSGTTESSRARLRTLLDRRDVQEQLQAYGVSAQEAAARVDALTDAEVVAIAGRLDDVPAGGNLGAAAVGAGYIIVGVAYVAALAVVGIGMLIVYLVKKAANAAKRNSN